MRMMPCSFAYWRMAAASALDCGPMTIVAPAAFSDWIPSYATAGVSFVSAMTVCT